MRRLAAVLVLAACTGRVESGEVPPGPPGAGDSRTCAAEKRATWRPVSEEGFPAAPGRTLLLWTGTEVLAAVDDSVPKALYDPCADRWREVIPPPDGFRYGLLAPGQGELFVYRDFEDILAVYDYASNRGRRPPTTGAERLDPDALIRTGAPRAPPARTRPAGTPPGPRRCPGPTAPDRRGETVRTRSGRR